MNQNNSGQVKRPGWLTIRVRSGDNLDYVEKILADNHLNTVCREANCPNRMECYDRKTATFMILGRICTRNCRFCNVTGGEPPPLDDEEPAHVAEAVDKLDLKHVVVTSVTRDDLPDGGSGHFARVVEAVRARCPGVIMEVLIPDFKGDRDSLEKVIRSRPHIINHNVETVPRLYCALRPQADYSRSLALLRRVKDRNNWIKSKSGIMVGVGETKEEVLGVLKDLRDSMVDFVTIGQYLAPSKEHYPVVEYIHPDRFAFYREEAYRMGFECAASSPLVRSSYHAADMFKAGG